MTITLSLLNVNTITKTIKTLMNTQIHIDVPDLSGACKINFARMKYWYGNSPSPPLSDEQNCIGPQLTGPYFLVFGCATLILVQVHGEKILFHQLSCIKNLARMMAESMVNTILIIFRIYRPFLQLRKEFSLKQCHLIVQI